MKTKSLFTTPSNVLPLRSSQNSNVDNILPDFDTNLSINFKIYRILLCNLYTVLESLEVKRVKRRGRQFPTQIPTNFSHFEFHHYSF